MYKPLLYIILFTLAAATMISCMQSPGYMTFTGYAQGGTYTVKANLEGVDASPESISHSIDSILSAIDRSVSGYNKGSLLSRLNAGETIVPDGILVDLYRKSAVIYGQTGGCVDVASAPLYDIWGFGFSQGEFPSDAEVARVLASSGMDRLVPDMESVLSPDGSLDPRALLKDGVGGGGQEPALARLNFNAVAQGYSCDLVAAYLSSLGVKDMMVDIGEIFCQGLNPKGLPWTLGIDRPVDGNNDPGADLQGIFRAPETPSGIVTSGNYRKFYVRDGRKYAHTVDPRTGYPVTHQLLSATVVAPDAFTADALATYCMVVGPEDARQFISSRDDLEACLVIAEADSTGVWCSDGFVLGSL
ncbi:MAG: FAD:protein FMN transferase [Candidatus Cryptobacteroides sp.]